MRRQVGLALHDDHYRALRAMAAAAGITPCEIAEALVVGAIAGGGRRCPPGAGTGARGS